MKFDQNLLLTRRRQTPPRWMKFAAPAFAAVATVSVAGSLALGLVGPAASPASASAAVRTASPIAAAAQAALDVLAGATADPAPTHWVRRTMDHAEFAARRRDAAAEVASALGIDAAALDASWVAAGPTRLKVVLTALAQVGVRYRYADEDPNDGFDCSGLTAYAWTVAGIDLPHASDTQLRGGVRRGADQARAGDLVGYSGHVMLYLGVDQAIIHAPYSGRNVEVQLAGRWSGRFTDPSQPVA